MILQVGTTFDDVTESTEVLVGTLLLAIPVAVVLLAGVVWWLVGRTLKPVENIRSEVAEIGATDLHRRVPLPAAKDEIGRLGRNHERDAGAPRTALWSASNGLSATLPMSCAAPWPGCELRSRSTWRRLGEADSARLRKPPSTRSSRCNEWSRTCWFWHGSTLIRLPVRTQPVDLDDLVLKDRQAAQGRRPHRCRHVGGFWSAGRPETPINSREPSEI